MPESRPPLNLAPILRRAEQATPGPWKPEDANAGTESPPFWMVTNDAFHNPPDDDLVPWIAVEIHVGDRADAEFIAAAREDVPALAAEVADLRDVLHRVRAVLADWSNPRRHMSDGHPMAELLDRLDEALSEPAQTKGEDR